MQAKLYDPNDEKELELKLNVSFYYGQASALSSFASVLRGHSGQLFADERDGEAASFRTAMNMALGYEKELRIRTAEEKAKLEKHVADRNDL